MSIVSIGICLSAPKKNDKKGTSSTLHHQNTMRRVSKRQRRRTRRTTTRVRRRRYGQTGGFKNVNRLMLKLGKAIAKGLGLKEKAY